MPRQQHRFLFFIYPLFWSLEADVLAENM